MRFKLFGVAVQPPFGLPNILISSLALACTALLVVLFREGLRRSRLSLSQQRRATRLLCAGFAIWFLVAGLLAHFGFFSNFSAMPPRLLLALLLPAVVLTIAMLRSTSLREALQHAPVAWLIYLQAFRILVELLLWRGYKIGAIPVQMTFAGRNFDILAGLTAPLAGWLWQRTQSVVLGVVWNVCGLLLLLNIVAIAMLSMPTPLRMFTEGPANTLLTHFPFIYLPAVLVPIAYTAHVLSLRQLWARRSTSTLPEE